MKSRIAFFFGILAAACSDEVQPELTVVHRNLNDVKAGYAAPFLLDVDQDGQTDYTFNATLIGYAGGEETWFKVVPLKSNRTLVAGEEIRLLEEGSQISSANQFNKYAEPIVVKTTTANEVRWSGTWKDASNKFIGVDFLAGDGRRYFGWVKVSFSQSEEMIIIHELAYSIPQQSQIKTGQVEAIK